MSNKERNNKQRDDNKARAQDKQARSDNRGDNRDTNRADDTIRSTDLRDSPMMAHLMDSMQRGEDIGHFGRLTFVMVAQYFLSDEEILEYLNQQPEVDEKENRIMLAQVRERGYNPPKRDRILAWMEQQDFPICPDTSDLNGCNVYRELQFPDQVYGQIDEFWEEKVEAEESDSNE